MMKTKAIRMERFGGPEVMHFADVELPEPGPGEVRLKHTAIGLNFIDTYYRTGLYPTQLPSGMGSEAAGVIEAVGNGVEDLTVGTRVVYTGRSPMDAYSERRIIHADFLVPVPQGISDEEAASVFLKGLTAWYLLRRSYRLKAGDPILLYAAAGGVGSLASQWANHLGATVIGVVGNKEKAYQALALGCHHVIISGQDDIARRARELTAGEGVAAAYDSVGRETFFSSLDSLRPHGVMVSFGNSSGPVEPFSPLELSKRHSNPASALRFHRFPRASPRGGRRIVRPGERLGCENSCQPALCAGRCRAGASGSRSPQNHRFDRPDSLACNMQAGRALFLASGSRTALKSPARPKWRKVCDLENSKQLQLASLLQRLPVIR